MLSGHLIQVSKLEMEFLMIDIVYACIITHARTYIFMYIYMRLGTSDLYIDEAHTALDKFRFVVFSYSKNSSSTFFDLWGFQIPTEIFKGSGELWDYIL